MTASHLKHGDEGSASEQVKGMDMGVPESAIISSVDDDASVRDAIKSLLKSVGFRVAVFASAEDFLYSDQLQDTACLILDVRMPGMSGLELPRHLGAGPWRMPIIFITAHGEEVARARALHAGVADCLRQPFSEEALLDAVHSAFEPDNDGASRSSSSRTPPTFGRQEMAGRRCRMAASTQTRRFALRQVSDAHPRDATLHVILLASSVNIVEE
jgi:DNA-binding response OmpR family regulator